MTNLSFERLIAEVIKMRESYAKEVNADITATAILDDILEMFEIEMVS